MPPRNSAAVILRGLGSFFLFFLSQKISDAVPDFVSRVLARSGFQVQKRAKEREREIHFFLPYDELWTRRVFIARNVCEVVRKINQKSLSQESVILVRSSCRRISLLVCSPRLVTIVDDSLAP
jgi:hypothetical protein